MLDLGPVKSGTDAPATTNNLKRPSSTTKGFLEHKKMWWMHLPNANLCIIAIRHPYMVKCIDAK